MSNNYSFPLPRQRGGSGDKIKKSPFIKTLKDRQEEYWKNFLDQFLDDFIDQELSDIIDPIEDIRKRVRSSANTAFANFVAKKQSSFVKECKARGEIWVKDEYPYNRHWIVDDPKIKKTLERHPKLLDIINFINKESQYILSTNRKSLKVVNKDRKEKKQISYFCVDKEFYERAQSKLGLKQITIQKYLQAFCKIGIFKMVKKRRLSGSAAVLYTDGYYYHTPVGLTKVHWMTAKKHQKALRVFSYNN